MWIISLPTLILSLSTANLLPISPKTSYLCQIKDMIITRIIIIYFQSALYNIIPQTKYSVTWPHHGNIFEIESIHFSNLQHFFHVSCHYIFIFWYIVLKIFFNFLYYFAFIYVLPFMFACFLYICKVDIHTKKIQVSKNCCHPVFICSFSLCFSNTLKIIESAFWSRIYFRKLSLLCQWN